MYGKRLYFRILIPKQNLTQGRPNETHLLANRAQSAGCPLESSLTRLLLLPGGLLLKRPSKPELKMTHVNSSPLSAPEQRST